MILHHYIIFPYRFMNKMMLLTRILVYFADNQEFKGKVRMRA